MEQSSASTLSSCSSTHFLRKRHEKHYVLGKPRERRRDIEGRFQPLQVWLEQHSRFPYPSYDEKLRLAEKGHMTIAHVTNWFANARRRLKLSYPDSNKVDDKSDRIDWEYKIKQAAQSNTTSRTGRKRKVEMTDSSKSSSQTHPEYSSIPGTNPESKTAEKRPRINPHKFKSTIIDRYLSEKGYPTTEHISNPI